MQLAVPRVGQFTKYQLQTPPEARFKFVGNDQYLLVIAHPLSL